MFRVVLDQHAVQPQLPHYEEISHPAIRDAAATWDAAKATLRERRQNRVELENTRPAAEWKDAEAIEAARAAGKPDPKRSNVQEHDRKIAEAHLEEKVAILAEKRAFDELQKALDDHQAEWLEGATREIEALSKAWNAAVRTLASLHGKLTEAHRARAYASNGDKENDGPGVLTGAIRVGPADVRGLDFAPTPEGALPGAHMRAPKGIVGIEHVLTQLAEMGRLPKPEEPEPVRETQTANILGATRQVPVPLTDEQRTERAQRAEARRAQHEQQRAEIHALIHGGDE